MSVVSELFTVDLYLIALLIFTAVAGDLVSHTHVNWFKAVFDNATHAGVGILCWFMVCYHYRSRNTAQTVAEIFSCGAMASLIDLDHFLMAKSLDIKVIFVCFIRTTNSSNFQDAVNLPSRPPFHSSSFPLFICFTIFVPGYFLNYEWILRISLIIFTAFASHHTRDAYRRGYWFYPIGSTQPIPYIMYILTTILIPYLNCLILKSFNSQNYNQLPTEA